MSFTREGLTQSEAEIGQIYPVLLDKNGKIIDGYHRKAVNPDWKELTIDTDDPIKILKIRVHAQYRRDVPPAEKKEWVNEARRLLQKQGKEGTQREIADLIGMSQQWVSKYDDEPVRPRESNSRIPHRGIQTNVWGLENGAVIKGDQDQPDTQFHHGVTPSFVIENLVQHYKPKKVLDTMAGIGTTKYACEKYPEIVEKIDQYDLNPFPKHDVQKGDAENPPTNDTYDLIFNHIPYLGMVKYSDQEEDLSNLKLDEFTDKMRRIFHKNYELLEEEGVYSVLVGDWRHGGQIIPITAYITILGLECGFVLWDEAVKLSAEQTGKQLQEYRAAKHGYLPQNYDTVLMFKKREAT